MLARADRALASALLSVQTSNLCRCGRSGQPASYLLAYLLGLEQTGVRAEVRVVARRARNGLGSGVVRDGGHRVRIVARSAYRLLRAAQ